jgi:periplasmic protein CpxP/Spy
MKKSLGCLALAGALAFGLNTTALFAQQDQSQAQDQSQDQSQGQQGGHRGMNADRQLEHLTRVLNLTSDQQAQIKPILQDRDQKMQALWQDPSTDQQDKRSQMRSIRQNSNVQIEAVLTDQQKQQFEQMQQHMHGHRGGMNQNGGDNGGEQPPQ